MKKFKFCLKWSLLCMLVYIGIDIYFDVLRSSQASTVPYLHALKPHMLTATVAFAVLFAKYYRLMSRSLVRHTKAERIILRFFNSIKIVDPLKIKNHIYVYLYSFLMQLSMFFVLIIIPLITFACSYYVSEYDPFFNPTSFYGIGEFLFNLQVCFLFLFVLMKLFFRNRNNPIFLSFTYACTSIMILLVLGLFPYFEYMMNLSLGEDYSFKVEDLSGLIVVLFYIALCFKESLSIKNFAKNYAVALVFFMTAFFVYKSIIIETTQGSYIIEQIKAKKVSMNEDAIQSLQHEMASFSNDCGRHTLRYASEGKFLVCHQNLIQNYSYLIIEGEYQDINKVKEFFSLNASSMKKLRKRLIENKDTFHKKENEDLKVFNLISYAYISKHYKSDLELEFKLYSLIESMHYDDFLTLLNKEYSDKKHFSYDLIVMAWVIKSLNITQYQLAESPLSERISTMNERNLKLKNMFTKDEINEFREGVEMSLK